MRVPTVKGISETKLPNAATENFNNIMLESVHYHLSISLSFFLNH
jgi:hypothetical protein